MATCPTCGKDVKEKAPTLYVCDCKTIFTIAATGRGYKGSQPTKMEIWGKAENYRDTNKMKMSGVRALPKMRKEPD